MPRGIKIAATFAAVLPSLLVAQGAIAEGGTYESINSFVTNYASFEHADQTTIIGGPANGVATIFDSSGGPFLKGASSVIDCITFANKSTAGMDLEAPCAITDSSGDKNFIVYKRKAGDVSAGGGGQGTIQIMGGTGKFAGVTGSCIYTVAFFPGNRGVTTQKCRWQKP